MDFQYYINLLLKRKWVILLSALLGGAVAFFVATTLPKVYRGELQLQTGVLNYDGNPGEVGFVQEFFVNAHFDNLIQEFRSRKMLTLESYRLLVNDLSHDEATLPFRKPKEDISDIPKSKIDELLQVLRQKIREKDPALDSRYMGLYTRLAKAYGYDYESLLKKLEVERVKKTDYLRISFDDTNPLLAAFVPNNLVKDYISMVGDDKYEQQKDVIANYEQLVKEKRAVLDSITQLMDTYMRQKAVTDRTQESKVLVSDLSDAQSRLAEAEKRVRYLHQAIRKVSGELEALKTTGHAGGALAQQRAREIRRLQDEIDQMRSQYIAGGQKDKDLMAAISQKEKQYKLLIKSSSTHLIRGNSRDTKEQIADLRKKKLDLELQLQDAEASKEQYAYEVARLKSKIPDFISNDTYLTKLTAEKEHIEDQLRDLEDNLSNARATNTKQKVRLKVVQYAQVPEEPKDRKIPWLTAFATAGSGALATILVFLSAFFDHRLTNANQFKQFVDLPLLGTLPYVERGLLPGRLFKEDDPTLSEFKERLRDIRFRVDESGEKIFLVTSLRPGDGKSFLITNLAEALAVNGKKVLVMDTNFRQNSLSSALPKGTFRFGIILRKLLTEYGLERAFTLREDANGDGEMAAYDLLGNRGFAGTPMEILAGKDFIGFLEELGELYDIILMEGAGLALYSDSKELIRFCDTAVSVFSAKTSLDSRDRDAIRFLREHKDKHLGAVLNGVKPGDLE